MRSRGPGIRLRLTLSYIAVLLLILLALSLVIYQLMRDRVETMIEAEVDTGYATVESVLINSGGDIYDLVHLGDDELILLLMNSEPEYQTPGWDRAGLPVERAGLGFEGYARWTPANGRTYMARKGSIPEYRYTLYYAKDITDAAAIPGELALILVTAGALAASLSIIGGYLLAGRALAPVQAITDKARSISAESLSERLPVPHEKDEIGRLAAVFNDTLSRLESSFESLKRFTADASHELRTPLTSIRSVGEVALRGPVDTDAYGEAISSMLEETERLTRLVEELLVLARGDASPAGLRRMPIELRDVVMGVFEELQILATEKAQKMSFGYGDGLIVSADRSTMTLALSNVIHNAIRYTPVGGQIAIHTGTDDGNAYVEIRDSGPGIPDAEREKVFERFYRVDRSRSSGEGGFGLGLAIARWAVEANGGRIAFIDSGDRGSICRITLPLIKKVRWR
jgi:heavy metal sensor kinase